MNHHLFNNLFKFMSNGKLLIKKCVCPQETCDCHKNGTETFITTIDFDENRYKTKDVTYCNGIVNSVSEESDWKT